MSHKDERTREAVITTIMRKRQRMDPCTVTFPQPRTIRFTWKLSCRRMPAVLMLLILWSEAFTTNRIINPHYHRRCRPSLVSSRLAADPSPRPLSTQQRQQQSPDLVSIDPVLLRVLRQTNTTSRSSIQHLGGNLVQVSHGLQMWRSALLKGRLPVLPNKDTTTTMTTTVLGAGWPPSPLYDRLVHDVLVPLQIPRLTCRHPEIVPLILASLLQWTMKYSCRLGKLHKENDTVEAAKEEEEDFYFLQWQEKHQAALAQENLKIDTPHLILEEDHDSIARDVVKSFREQWSGVVNGVGILDGLFGIDHGLLNIDYDKQSSVESGSGTMGYGVQDGIWSHTGWNEIPKLQKELANLPELSQLIQTLGRRPTAENSKGRQKFAPRKPNREGGLGADVDARRCESIDGITLSSNLSEMLPSEALLLCGNSTTLRRLFLAKKVESKLLSYQLSGWTDIPSVPRTRCRYRSQLPSAPGGPIIICLDTSWSMSTGRREALSKAVVLACVTQAHQQGRDCQVVAFSTERGTMESGILTPSSSSRRKTDNGSDIEDGIPRLLNFLTHSFGGGTDVTGALKFAMASLQDDLVLAASDILLVTDGEIADPPVPPEIMEQLDTYKLKLGTQIHGLLIGKKESRPLSRLCTTTHHFLSHYDSNILENTVPERPKPTDYISARRSRGQRQRYTTTALFAKRKRSKGGDSEDDDDSYASVNGHGGGSMLQIGDIDENETEHESSDIFIDTVAKKVKELQESADELISSRIWSLTDLQKERSKNGSRINQAHQQLLEAILRVEDGLVERGEEARLVVLAMITGEHILLLGSPGTAKSVLGQRLAKLCNGKFFQRLLTRFTTPEELFGPLSLKSLEQDEYRRCTAGFLPTADIAFLDEIFKANSAILNTLLTILNERKFDNAGGQETCPIRCVVGASNELPDSDDLVALFDRFLIRKEVSPVSDEGIMTLLELSNLGVPSCQSISIDADDDQCESFRTNGLDAVIDSLTTASASVVMERDAAGLMRDLRTYLREELSVQVSDRRLVKATRLLKICAASNGRSKVDFIDFFVLQHCFWNVPEERVPIRDWLWDHLTPEYSSVEQFRFLLESLRTDIVSVVQKTSGDVSGQSGARTADLDALESLIDHLKSIQEIIEQKVNNLARHMELVGQANDLLWLGDDDTTAIRQLLLPKAESVFSELRRAAVDARTLEAALSPLVVSDNLRLETILALWQEGYAGEIAFTEGEKSLSMREAKARYDVDTFRRWKRATKKTGK